MSVCDVLSVGVRVYTFRNIILLLTSGSSRLCDLEEDEGTAVVRNVWQPHTQRHGVSRRRTESPPALILTVADSQCF